MLTTLTPRTAKLFVLSLVVLGLTAAPALAAGRHPKTQDTATVESSGRVKVKVVGRLSPDVRRKLTNGFSYAVKRLRADPACQAMFTELGADGVQILAQTTYEPAPSDKEVAGGTATGKDGNFLVAYTRVRSSRILLTEIFGRLSTDAAAAFLIHEALHYAGLGEYPADPDALNSFQITQVVAQSCGLRGFDPPAPGLTLTGSVEGP